MESQNTTIDIIVKNLWKTYKYSREYQSFLLGTMSGEDFLKISDNYGTLFKKMSEEEIRHLSILLANILEEPLSPVDLSVLLNVDPMDIVQSLKSS